MNRRQHSVHSPAIHSCQTLQAFNDGCHRNSRIYLTILDHCQTVVLIVMSQVWIVIGITLFKYVCMAFS